MSLTDQQIRDMIPTGEVRGEATGPHYDPQRERGLSDEQALKFARAVIAADRALQAPAVQHGEQP